MVLYTSKTQKVLLQLNTKFVKIFKLFQNSVLSIFRISVARKYSSNVVINVPQQKASIITKPFICRNRKSWFTKSWCQAMLLFRHVLRRSGISFILIIVLKERGWSLFIKEYNSLRQYTFVRYAWTVSSSSSQPKNAHC